MHPDFYIKLKSLYKFERGSINPVKIGEIPPSGLGGNYYSRTTEGRREAVRTDIL